MDTSDAFGILALLFAVGGGLYLFWSRPGRTGQHPGSAPVRAGDARTADTIPPKLRSPERGSEPPVGTRIGSKPALPRLDVDAEEDEEVDPTRIGQLDRPIQPPVEPIVFDDGADSEAEGDRSFELVVHALAQTDPGKRRKQNEDSLLVLDNASVFVVADGMGGHRGGELASKLAVSTIGDAFGARRFEADPHKGVPAAASELARAIQMANRAILSKAAALTEFAGMGTTICAARFSSNRRRLYVGHVGDSRCYRVRDGVMKQMTRDHTMADFGVAGPQGAHLSRAVGIWPTVPIDIVMCKPQPGDVYLLCSDGLTKMVPDEAIAAELLRDGDPRATLESLIQVANAEGGRDNITVIHMRVAEPRSAG